MIAACKRVLKYLEKFPSEALTFVGNGRRCVLEADSITDASVQSVVDDRSSVIAVMVRVQGAPICHLVRKLRLKALSSAEGELKAMNTAYSIVKYLQQLCEEIETAITMPTPLLGDCKPAQGAAQAPGSNRSEMVHVETSAFNLKDGIDAKEIDINWIAGAECAADALTKALGRRLFEKFRPFLLGVAPHAEAAALVAQAYARATSAVRCGVMSNDDAIAALVASVVSKCA